MKMNIVQNVNDDMLIFEINKTETDHQFTKKVWLMFKKKNYS